MKQIRNQAFWVRSAIGAGIMAGSLLVFSTVCALLIWKEILPQNSMETLGALCSTLSAYIGASMVTRGKRESVLPMAACSCGMYLAALLLVHLLALPGGLNGWISITAGASAAAFAAALIRAGRAGRRPAKKR